MHAILPQLAWQIGNRHLEAQIETERILIRRDHVIEAMLGGLGATTREVTEIFKPETGAYGGHHPMATDASQAVAPAQLDVADISGRRLCLFARARMGNRNRRS